MLRQLSEGAPPLIRIALAPHVLTQACPVLGRHSSASCSHSSMSCSRPSLQAPSKGCFQIRCVTQFRHESQCTLFV
eukprot:scaffold75502_cov51-Phaeocystis_antarctica.AAC.1